MSLRIKYIKEVVVVSFYCGDLSFSRCFDISDSVVVDGRFLLGSGSGGDGSSGGDEGSDDVGELYVGGCLGGF